ncbi:MAG: aminotransferase class III-fold pyridoxal phosphate-dependent enzyme [bacterium]|nr:MAG: aminotransferase class III-fold pyridoxal phosphate-dependent enzyme [bacterium]
MLNLEKSKKLFTHALEIIPGGTNTNAKRVYNLLDVENFPAYIERGDGAYLWDIDGNKYIDYIAALAPINIGYNNPRIKAKIKEQLEKGSLFSLSSPNEVELSEMLIEKIPCAEMVKIMKTGAEVTSAAIRAARLATGKEMILSSGYHGWHDWWAAKIGEKGIPSFYKDLIYNFQFNNYAQFEQLVEKHYGNIACIILTAAAYGVEPKNKFLQKIRKLTDQKGIVLIFDEIITGFRWAMGGAQEKYGVMPDLAAFGKGMANGMPISVLVGKKELMAPLKNNLITSTFSSEALSIAASIETIKIIEGDNIIQRLYDISDKLRAGISEISQQQNFEIDVMDPTPAVKFEFLMDEAEKKKKMTLEFIKQCAAKGILVRQDGTGISLCVMAALSDSDIDYTLNTFDGVIKNSKFD